MDDGRLQFLILGPLEVRAGGELLGVGGTRQRALLALLLLNANRVVSRDRLIDELNPDPTSGTAEHALHVQVSRLRKALATAEREPRVVARPPGYLLRVEPDELDLVVFERRVAQGRELLRDGDAEAAAETVARALALWRGRPLADLEFESFARVEVERLEELRLAALEDRIDADLACGRHVAVVPELESLIDAQPLRERPRAQLMLALYRGGRQAEALEAYREARQLLHDDLGLEPGVALQQLERAILEQDPALEPAWPERRIARATLDVCPFKGLASYTVGDADLFFGRERLVDELVGAVTTQNVVAIVGSSGSGKSSLLRAGLLAALAGGALAGSDAWDQIVMRPGDRPATSLGRALAAVSSGGAAARLVIAVDQFEELFTSCTSEDERRRFVDALLDLAWDADRPAVLLLALRADFYGHLALDPQLAALAGGRSALVGPMSRAELRRVITGPVERVGLEIETSLVDELVDDIVDEPGGLPLLSTALLELWTQRDGAVLRLSDYERMGRVRGAVARMAESAYACLDPSERAAARRLFLRLAASSDDGTVVRSRVPLDDLEDGDLTVAATALSDRRLVTVDEESVEVAHEALLREWPRLREWLAEDAEGRRLHGRLGRAAAEWDEGGRDPAGLYRGRRLAAAKDWADDPDNARRLNQVESAFLDAGVVAAARERDRQRRANRRLLAALAAVLALLLLAVVAGAVALEQRSHARQQATVADAGRLGAQALIDPSLDGSLLLAREAFALDDSEATQSSLLAALLRSPQALAVVRVSDRPLIDEALSSDGRTLAVLTDNGRVVFVDTSSWREEGPAVDTGDQLRYQYPSLTTPIRSLAFSPDGRTLAVGSSNGTDAVFALVDVRTHRPRFVPASGALVADAVYSADGRALVTGEREPCCGPRREVVVLRAPSGKVLARSRAIVNGRVVGYVDHDRSLLVTDGPSSALLLNARTLKVERPLRVGDPAAISPDEQQVAFGASNGDVSVLDLNGGRARSIGHLGSSVTALGFSRPGTVLAAAGADGSVTTWDVRSGLLRQTFTGHPAQAVAPVFDVRRGALIAAGDDGTAIVWDATGRAGLERVLAGAGADPSATSETGLFATSVAVDRVMLWDARSLESKRALVGPFGKASDITLSGNGRVVAAAGSRAIAIWDAATGRLKRLLPAASVDALALDRAGAQLAVASSHSVHGIVVYDVAGGTVTHVYDNSGASWTSVRFSPDGRSLAVADLSGRVTVWRLTDDGIDVQVSPGKNIAVFAVAFSPDGSRLATGDSNDNVTVWSTKTGSPVGRPLTGNNGLVLGLSFDPTGGRLASSSADGNIRLWDVASRKLIGAPLPGGGGGALSFFAGGSKLFAVSRLGVETTWDVDPADWATRACRVANRTLTQAEWRAALPARPYRAVCPSP